MSVKWISIPEYSNLTGLSRVNINKLIDEDRLIVARTEGGQIRIKLAENTEFLDLKKELLEQKEMLITLCKHLGVLNQKVR